MVLLGWVSYHLLIMVELNQAHQSINPLKYIASRPAKFLLSVTGAVMGYILTDATLPADVSPAISLSAFAGVGFTPYMIFDYIGKKTKTAPIKPPVNTAPLTGEEIASFQKLPKFQAHDVTTWIKR